MPTAAEAKKNKRAHIQARLNCGASSSGEKATARKILEEFDQKTSKSPTEGLTRKGVPDTVRMWTMEATLRQPDGNRLVHHSALSHFLEHVRDGQWIDNRSIPLAAKYGSGDHYNILYWLQSQNLVEKVGSKYRIVSVSAIKRMWQKLAKTLLFGE